MRELILEGYTVVKKRWQDNYFGGKCDAKINSIAPSSHPETSVYIVSSYLTQGQLKKWIRNSRSRVMFSARWHYSLVANHDTTKSSNN